MAGFFARLFRNGSTARIPVLPSGMRVYAIGDVHGRLDLLEALAEAIERDDATRAPAQTAIVLLGDLVDRGPDSAGVLDFVRNWAAARDVRFISGNHEEMFLLAFFERAAFKSFLRYGGAETLQSYGLDAATLREMEFADVKDTLARAVPKADRDFMRGFEKCIRLGDYLFVHAGIHPKVPLDEQAPHDCRWIREPFLSHKGDLGCFVVHGHTVTPQADLRDNRIGIDTGAFASGVLTALCLEGTDRRLIQTETDGAQIGTRELPANCANDLAQAMPGSL